MKVLPRQIWIGPCLDVVEDDCDFSWITLEEVSRCLGVTELEVYVTVGDTDITTGG